ncbi:MAG: DUF4256 domain-containing protein [Bacteroidales bacterium]|jgi:hypothetical protein|nr:DUF4256 domain-containing protein [Bacteroidales bacterium]MDD3701548.1 DUF4256 domain-containing protein [Bacteroidales bacterium]MDY0369480.1 DUF4256 domain-containing protein [Bacteroidales bacterium]
MNNKIIDSEKENLLETLKLRFEKNESRHKNIQWSEVEAKLKEHPNKLWSIHAMEITGGEPDVIGYDKLEDAFIFCDCSTESPKNRRSLCYDHKALELRKEHKPKNSAVTMAYEMGIELLDEEQYSYLQSLGNFDTKTSSWLKTPKNVREAGGAIFGDFRFGRVFYYHNSAESYYAARGFRGLLKV